MPSISSTRTVKAFRSFLHLPPSILTSSKSNQITSDSINLHVAVTGDREEDVVRSATMGEWRRADAAGAKDCRRRRS